MESCRRRRGRSRPPSPPARVGGGERERGGEEKLREGEDEAEYIFVWVDSDEKREKQERS